MQRVSCNRIRTVDYDDYLQVIQSLTKRASDRTQNQSRAIARWDHRADQYGVTETHDCKHATKATYSCVAETAPNSPFFCFYVGLLGRILRGGQVLRDTPTSAITYF